MKNGKSPISSKKVIDSLAGYHETDVVSLLDVDPRLKSFLEGQGLVLRWINASNYVKSGGFDKNGWKALRMSDVPSEVQESITIGAGTSAEGYLVRKDLLLAVRGERVHEKHKMDLKSRADRKLGIQKQHADTLKEKIGQAGGKVHEGYDEND